MRALSLSVLLLSSAALARTEYQTALKSAWSLASTPDCTTCHNAVPEQCGNTGTKFALTLKTKASITTCPSMTGTAPAQISVITAGLNAMKTDMTDSDNDGMSDYNELVAGRNPNVVGTGIVDAGSTTDAGKAGVDAGAPMGGCSTVPQGSTVPVPLVLGALGLLALAVMRRQLAR